MDLAKSLQIEVAAQAESLTKGVHPQCPRNPNLETLDLEPESRNRIAEDGMCQEDRAFRGRDAGGALTNGPPSTPHLHSLTLPNP